MPYDRSTLYVIGDAQSSVNNPITQQYSAFFIGLVVEQDTGLIVDAGCSSTIPLTSEFVKSIFIGCSVLDVDAVSEEIRRRYHGSSQKALIVAFKDASKKFKSTRSGREEREQPTSGSV